MSTPCTVQPEDVRQDLTPQTLHSLGRDLPRTDTVLQLGSACLSLYRAKRAHDPEWTCPAAQQIVYEARRSYRRFGAVPPTDSYDSKAAVYLVWARYPARVDEHVVPAEEWLTIRFVPGDGKPVGSLDLRNCRCKGQPIGTVIQSALFGEDEDCLPRVASISRMCGITPYALEHSSTGHAGWWMAPRQMRYGAAAFALINRVAMEDVGHSWRYLTGLSHPKLLTRSFAVRTRKDRLLPTFTTAHEQLGLASPRMIVLNRSVEAYRYPGYFLNVRQLRTVLAQLVRSGHLSQQTLECYLGDVDGDRGDGKWNAALGSMLTVSGPLVGARITGEELRACLDQAVEDGPVLHIMEGAGWREDMEQMIDTLEQQAAEPSHGAKPVLYEAAEAHATGAVAYETDGNALVTDARGVAHRVPTDRQYDLTQATMFGLNERLTISARSPHLDDEGTLRERFNREWESYAKALENADGERLDYGVYAFYTEREDLVRYCPRSWHRIAAVASSSKLLCDPARKLTWRQIRSAFENTTVAVAGGSVGNSILHGVVMDMRPNHVKIADPSLFKMENINRVRLRYDDLVTSNRGRSGPHEPTLRNKAAAAAGQIYAIDPYITVHVYDEGVGDANVSRFLGGGMGEPATDVVVDEVDDLMMKLQIREHARARRIPVVMLTDIGSAVQLDVLRYDLDPGLSLAYGADDDALYEALRACESHPGSRDVFFDFADLLLGPEYRRQSELWDILVGNSEVPTATLFPQLGSTAALAGAIAGETIARMRLGEAYPARAVVDKHALRATAYC